MGAAAGRKDVRTSVDSVTRTGCPPRERKRTWTTCTVVGCRGRCPDTMDEKGRPPAGGRNPREIVAAAAAAVAVGVGNPSVRSWGTPCSAVRAWPMPMPESR